MTIIESLLNNAETKNAAFQAKLTPTLPRESFLGVRVPKLREIEKQFRNTKEAQEFLHTLPHTYYDEYLLHSVFISNMKDYDAVMQALEEFLPFVDNWAVCDTLRPNAFKKHSAGLLEQIKVWISSEETYTCRFGIDMLMAFYLDGDFKPEYLELPAQVHSDEWNGYSETDCTHIMSATKSVMALLVGIAADRVMIGSVDDRVLWYFPDYHPKRGEKTIFDVTIRHLLTMRAPYKGKGDPWTKVCSSENWTETSLDFLGGRNGITDEFDYRTVCLHILSGILYKATGMKTVDFANEYLFEPLGIAKHRNYFAETAEEHKAFTLDKSPKENVWFSDPQGLGTPGYGLCMSAGDMAKLGLLCLNNGKWDGTQIVSRSWLEEMTAPRTVESDLFRGMSYGYLWWIIHPEKNIYAAIGNSGNVIYVDPEKDIAVAVSSFFKPTVFDRVDFIEENIIPFILGDI